MYRISYRFLVPGWSAKPLVSAHYRINGHPHPWPQTPPPGTRTVIAALTNNHCIHQTPEWIHTIDISEQ